MTTTECIPWEGYKDANGYGRVTREGRTSLPLHRYLYEQEHGEQPGLHVHHDCGNRSCINLDHLRAVTPQEHQRLDQARRKRCRNGHPYEVYGAPERGTARRCRACQRYAAARRKLRAVMSAL